MLRTLLSRAAVSLVGVMIFACSSDACWYPGKILFGNRSEPRCQSCSPSYAYPQYSYPPQYSYQGTYYVPSSNSCPNGVCPLPKQSAPIVQPPVLIGEPKK